jgi:Tol biopolymer transport system component
MSDTIPRLNAALEGRYVVERELGEGGMATVYLAEDLKHSRRVALKVLKPELAAVVGAERFLSEIETTANLQHPHILPLHDSGEADGFLYYVMPYVDGETLRDRLERERQLPVDEAIGIGVSLAAALDHAHRRGVIHRDIKPANILLQDGQPVIADFGISLAVGTAGARLTETGLSVGTPYYMSPEQATGDQHVGPASDTYALACVVYEMLVGEPPFPGARHRSSVPLHVDATIRKGLEKLAADRFATAEQFAKALQDPGFRHGDVGSEETDDARWKRVAIGAIAAAAAFAGLAVWGTMAGPTELPITRYAVSLPEGHDPARPYGSNVAISPDGSTVVYVGPAENAPVGTQLWMRPRDQLDPTPIGGTDGGFSPVFSPDGTSVAYLTGSPNSINVVSLSGAPPLTVADSGFNANSLSWGDDGFIYTDFNDLSGIGRVPAGGGMLERVTATDSTAEETFHAWPHVLPGSRGMVATVGYSPVSDANAYRIAAFDFESGEHRVLAAGVMAKYVPTGHLVYASADGQLLAAGFDARTLEMTGSPVVLADGVSVGQFGSADLSVASDGTFVYMAGPASSGLARAVWVDREGVVTPIDPEWEFDPGMPEAALAISPDGTRLAVKINTEAGEDIWVKELDRGPLSRLTFDDGIDRRPRWSRDGTRIFYTSDRAGEAGSHFDLWAQRADGTGVPELMLDLEASILEAQLTPDESMFVLRLGGLSGAVGVRDLVSLRAGETETRPVATEPYDEKGLSLSPSGRWVAYESTETGRDEIYVRPFPSSNDGKWQVSTAGGINPKWAHSENELFFINGSGELVVADVRTDGDMFRVGQRRTLFSMAERFLDGQPNYASWDVALDDQRFVMLQVGGSGGDDVGRLVVVQNFFSVLEERAGS